MDVLASCRLPSISVNSRVALHLSSPQEWRLRSPGELACPGYEVDPLLWRSQTWGLTLQLLKDHRADAVRILDFAHAAEHISDMGKVAIGAGSALADDWLAKQLHELKHNGPSQVLVDLRVPVARHPDVKELTDNLAYLAKRAAQMQYPTFQAAGWPIGSGCVESANKVVVQARLKGAGMHWECHNVNPMLVLRNAVRNGR